MKAVEFHTFLEQKWRQNHSVSVIHNPWGVHVHRAINYSLFGNSWSKSSKRLFYWHFYKYSLKLTAYKYIRI